MPALLQVLQLRIDMALVNAGLTASPSYQHTDPIGVSKVLNRLIVFKTLSETQQYSTVADKMHLSDTLHARQMVRAVWC